VTGRGATSLVVAAAAVGVLLPIGGVLGVATLSAGQASGSVACAVSVTATPPGTSPTPTVSAPACSWTKPIVGARVSSGFGTRWHPILHTYRLHAGVDLAAPCGTAIYAASAGTVVSAGGLGASTQADLIELDHGAGVATAYMHMDPGGVWVAPGQVVSAGQQIGQVGSSGLATGCHLHFEVRLAGTPVEPVAAMAERGVILP
jgi:murein DD-endopeptidase MepM/ murein hydrolase activator NlpD